MLQRSEYSYVNKIRFYYVCAMLELLSFVLVVRKTENPGQFVRDAFLVFLSIILEYVFIVDALINRNIYQIKQYPFLGVYSIVLASMGLGVSKGIPIGWITLLIILLVIDSCATIYFISELQTEYKWFYYKKYGLSVQLQDMYKIKQQMVVFFKLDVIVTLTTLLYPVQKIPFKIFIITSTYTVSVINIFLFVSYYNSESYFARWVTIFFYIGKVVVLILEIIAFTFNVQRFNIFIPVSDGYDIAVSLLLVYYLYKDSLNFGKGLREALTKKETKTYTGLS